MFFIEFWETAQVPTKTYWLMMLLNIWIEKTLFSKGAEPLMQYKIFNFINS